MPKIEKYFRLARQIAVRGDRTRRRQYRLGAVGVRTDGTVVTANNLPCSCPTPAAHAEARLVRKLNFGSEVYVVRILRNGCMASARPCRSCQSVLRLRGVKTCWYSISEIEYGVLKL